MSAPARMPQKYAWPDYYQLRDMSEAAALPKPVKINLSPRSNRTVSDFIGQAQHDGCRSAIANLVGRIQFIDFNTFRTGLFRGFVSLLENVNPKLRTAVGVVPSKSNEWVTKIAMSRFKMLSGFPCFNIDHKARLNLQRSMETAIERREYVNLPQQIILFDDGSYSGDQMVNHVESMIQTLKHKAKETTIFVLVPYMTTRARARLDAIQAMLESEYPNIKLAIADHETIQTVKELLSDDDYRQIRAIYPVLTEDDSGITLTCFDHKLPNSQSFFEPVAPLIKGIVTPYKGAAEEDGKKDH